MKLSDLPRINEINAQWQWIKAVEKQIDECKGTDDMHIVIWADGNKAQFSTRISTSLSREILNTVKDYCEFTMNQLGIELE